jgi:hypothetical protein
MALRQLELDASRLQHAALDADIGKIMVGEQHFHGTPLSKKPQHSKRWRAKAGYTLLQIADPSLHTATARRSGWR